MSKEIRLLSVTPVAVVLVLAISVEFASGIGREGITSDDRYRGREAVREGFHPRYYWEKTSKPMQWVLARPPVGGRIEIAASPRICIGRPRPKFGSIRIEGSRRAVVVTAEVSTYRHPAKFETCMGVGGGISKELTLPSPVGHRVLYDGSVDPPSRRWPWRPPR